VTDSQSAHCQGGGPLYPSRFLLSDTLFVGPPLFLVSGSLYTSWLEEGNLSALFQHGSFIPFLSPKICGLCRVDR
jgi:hypothetical protein